MKKVKIDEFLADYEKAVQEKADLLAERDKVIEGEKAKVDALTGFSDHVKEVLLEQVIAEKDAEFDTTVVDDKIAGFEKYLEEIEEELEQEVHPEDCQCDECTTKEEVQVDNFFNPIA